MESELFSVALGIDDPIYIDKIDFDSFEGELHIHANFRRGSKFPCSECGIIDLCIHDTLEKTWRHLNFFQYKCYIHLRTPRTICPDCGEKLWIPPWGRKKIGFTLLFEALIMTLAKEMPISRIADVIEEHDTRIWRIVRHYVNKSYSEKSFEDVKKVGCDETSSRRGHNYVTVFADMDIGEVLFATEGRDSSCVKAFADIMDEHEAFPEQIKEVTIDMSNAFVSGVTEYLTEASITFDKFHVIQSLNKAVDEVRREEQKSLPLLKNSRYIWLKNPGNLTKKQESRLKDLSSYNLKTAKAYKMKLTFQDIYREIRDPEVAEAAINKWLSWATRSRLEPMKKFAQMVKSHFDGIMRYFTSRLTSGAMEGINSRIQEIKRRGRGFRNVDNFIAMIYLEAAGLDLRNTHFK